LVEIRFGRRIDYLVFVPATDAGVLEGAARVPALDGQSVNYFFGVSPGDRQIPRNAPTDLVAEFVFRQGSQEPSLPIVEIVVTPWDEGRDTVGSARPSEEDLGKLRALFCAAVRGAGRRPAVSGTAPGLTLRVRKEAGGFGFRLETKDGEEANSLTLQNIPYEDVYDVLRIAACSLLEWNGALTDTFRIPDENFRPEALFEPPSGGRTPPLLVGVSEDKIPALVAWSPGGDKPAWRTSVRKFDALFCRDGVWFVLHDGGTSRLDPVTGRLEPAEGGRMIGGGFRSDDFSVDRENGELVARSGADDSKTLWKIPFGEPWIHVPERLGDRLLVASEDNRLLTVGLTTGEVCGEVKWPTWILQARVLPGNPVCVVCLDLRNRLTLLDGDLREIAQIRLPFVPLRWVGVADAFPVRWRSGEDDLPDERRMILVADSGGRYYMFDSIVVGWKRGAK
jgi:hypothetical protein